MKLKWIFDAFLIWCLLEIFPLFLVSLCTIIRIIFFLIGGPNFRSQMLPSVEFVSFLNKNCAMCMSPHKRALVWNVAKLLWFGQVCGIRQQYFLAQGNYITASCSTLMVSKMSFSPFYFISSLNIFCRHSAFFGRTKEGYFRMFSWPLELLNWLLPW